MEVNNLCAVRPESSTYQQLYIAKGPIIFYRLGWGRGGRGIFVATTEHLRDPPLKHTVWFWSPLFYPSYHKKARLIVTICKQVTSILILNVSWTLNNNFTYLVIWYELNCLIQIVENKVIVALFLLTVEFFLIFLIPWYPVPSLSSLAPHDSSVFTDSRDSLICR